MKRQIFIFVLAFIGIAGTVVGQTPATLPYSCDFESPGDNGWVLKNDTCTSKWHIGTPSGAEGASLYISSDGGTTAGYDPTTSSIVVAEKSFMVLASDSIRISFDLTVGGRDYIDCLKVFWVPNDTNYEATTNYTAYYAWPTYASNVIMSNHDNDNYHLVSGLYGTQRMTATVANESPQLKKLVFIWKNVECEDSPTLGAIIDNIRIVPVCPSVTALSVNNITQTSAEVSWNGETSSYEVRINGGEPDTVTTTNKIFTGLTEGTNYTVEVKSICDATHEFEWQSITFYTLQTPTTITMPYTCDFEADGDNGWLLKNGECTNKWYIGTPSGAGSASLYISGDGGTTSGYDNSTASVVVAEKLFLTGTSDFLTISFDVEVNGFEPLDIVKVFWTPADTLYEATTESNVYYSGWTYAPNAIVQYQYPYAYNPIYSSWYFVSSMNGTRRRITTTVANEPNSLNRLIFLWRNITTSGSHPGAIIIDNIRVEAKCPTVADLAVSNITNSSAKVSWGAETSSYQIRFNGGEPETVTSTSKTFTGLTEGTNYTVEVRNICAYNESDWDTVHFTTLCLPVSDLAASNITETSAEISWNGSATDYEIRLNGGEPETVTATNKTLTGLTELTDYTIEVRAVCSENISEWDTINFSTTQTPETLPYTCDFEAEGNNGWILKNSTHINKWYVGTPSGTESASMYISGDNGASAGYNETDAYSVVVAEKLFYTGSTDQLYISFDLTIGGDSLSDFLKVFWAPADTNYEATASYYSDNNFATNVIVNNNGHHFVNLLHGTQRMTDTITNEPNSLKKLIFLWKNDHIGGNQPGAIIDNIRIIPTCLPVTDLTANNITATSADVNWNGSSNSYEVRFNGGEPETVTNTSKTFTDLTEGTEYFVEVRNICAYNESDWDTVHFTTLCLPVTDLAANNITETSAEVSWNGTSSSYEVRINGGAAETVTTQSKTFTGLTNNTIYTVEVRGVCPEMSDVDWQTVTFYTLQTPAQLPYTCDFEAEDNNGWIIKNGTFLNKWFIGTPAGETSRSLYISCDDGVTACMDTNGGYSVVIAEKLFQTGTSEYTNISFDLQMDERFITEDGAGLLRVFWTPADSIFDVTINPSSSCYDLLRGDNIIMNNCTMGTTTVFCTHGFGVRTEMNATVANEPNSLRKLVFIYMSEGYDAFAAPVIDNISIKGVTEPCDAPTDLAVSNLTQTEATISWNGSATDYEVRLNNGEAETVSGTSKTFTGLTLCESYSVLVRAVCTESYSQWETVKFSTLQYPASIPYFCDFETADNNGWMLKNGECTNRWYIGTPDSTTNASLYISNNNGATADYNTEAGAVVVAEKLFQTGTSDSLTISFDLTIMGEGRWDYLKVFWVPADTNYEATTDISIYYSANNYISNVIMSNATDTAYAYVSELEGMRRMNVTIANEPNSLRKLVFLWRNNGSDGNNPGAIIDNLSIAENSDGSTEPCDVPTALSVSNITETEATLSWNGEATSYEIKLNGSVAETVSGTSKTLTNLSAGTVYMTEIRAVCENGTSAWVGINFTTLAACNAPTALTVSNITETSAEVSWNGSAAGYEVRLNGGEAETVTTTSKTFTGLTAGTAYTVEVRAVCEEGNSSEWVSTDFTTASSSGLEQVATNMEVFIYPNPAKDKAALSLNGLTANARLIVSDIQGKIVLTDSIAKGSERYELDLKGFASGVYSITIVSGNNKATHKLIVE